MIISVTTKIQTTEIDSTTPITTRPSTQEITTTATISTRTITTTALSTIPTLKSVDTTPSASIEVKKYKFCSIFLNGVLCRDAIINANNEFEMNDKTKNLDDNEENLDDNDEDSDDNEENMGISRTNLPPYFNNLRDRIERYSLIIQGLVKNFQNGNMITNQSN